MQAVLEALLPGLASPETSEAHVQCEHFGSGAAAAPLPGRASAAKAAGENAEAPWKVHLISELPSAHGTDGGLGGTCPRGCCCILGGSGASNV